MRSFPKGLPALAAAALFLGAVVSAHAQDHEKCYKIKDPAKIKGFADLTTPQFGLEPNCKVGPAKYFCAPASKTFLSATSAGVPILPLPVYGPPTTTDRICYKVKCPIPPPPFPPDQLVTDQYGTRTLAKFKAFLMCTPAVKGGGFCGNGVIDPGEDCDTPAVAGCPTGTCESDCTCTCPTACCYVEAPPPMAPPPGESECFEYTGTPGQVAAFMSFCTLGGPPIGTPGSILPGPPDMLNSALLGPCGLGPVTGLPCVVGPPGAGNLHFIPADSSCP